MICGNPAAADSRICMIPDVRPEEMGLIGLTMTVGDRVLPNLVGVDIGCGVRTADLGTQSIDLTAFDAACHEVPSGRSVWDGRRERIMAELLARTGLDASSVFHTVHNYIDTDEMILRKGAIAAHEGEVVLIPLNMRDGSVIARGRGNEAWNWSAPHGAGRVMSRTAARERLSLDEYRDEMAGVYSTSVCESTLDEAPAAYKPIDDIIGPIAEAVDIIDVMKPIFNFKAS